jgi:hypothetical protein
MPSSMAMSPQDDVVPSALDPTIGVFAGQSATGVIFVTKGTIQDQQRLHFAVGIQRAPLGSLQA